MKEIFDKIYESNKWGSKETRSGPGSESVETKRISTFIPSLIDPYGIASIVDIGCGQGDWQAKMLKEINKTQKRKPVSYVGMDIAQYAVDQIKEVMPAREHILGDASIEEEWPQGDFDLAIVRDVLMHVPYSAAGRILKTIKKRCKFLLATSYQENNNADGKPGSFRPLNLSLRPFYIGEPLEMASEQSRFSSTRKMCLWPASAIPDY